MSRRLWASGMSHVGTIWKQYVLTRVGGNIIGDIASQDVSPTPPTPTPTPGGDMGEYIRALQQASNSSGPEAVQSFSGGGAEPSMFSRILEFLYAGYSRVVINGINHAIASVRELGQAGGGVQVLTYPLEWGLSITQAMLWSIPHLPDVIHKSLDWYYLKMTDMVILCVGVPVVLGILAGIGYWIRRSFIKWDQFLTEEERKQKLQELKYRVLALTIKGISLPLLAIGAFLAPGVVENSRQLQYVSSTEAVIAALALPFVVSATMRGGFIAGRRVFEALSTESLMVARFRMWLYDMYQQVRDIIGFAKGD